MKNLITQMNKPDPRDIEFLQKERKSLEQSEKVTKKMIKQANLGQAKRHSRAEDSELGTLFDIPDVSERLIHYGQSNAQRHLIQRKSLLEKNEPYIIRDLGSTDFCKFGDDLQISPMSLSKRDVPKKDRNRQKSMYNGHTTLNLASKFSDNNKKYATI